MGTDRSAWWEWAVKNSVCVICWTVLAVLFNKWWIALFAGLFISSLKTTLIHKYYRICDKCGKHSPMTDDYNEAIDKAKECGWIIRKDGDKWDDRCPDCQEISN